MDAISNELNNILKNLEVQMNPSPYKNYSWAQAKKKFPNLNPSGDFDMDGVVNSKDCRPFDPTRQDLKSWLKSKFTRSPPRQIETSEQKEKRFASKVKVPSRIGRFFGGASTRERYKTTMRSAKNVAYEEQLQKEYQRREAEKEKTQAAYYQKKAQRALMTRGEKIQSGVKGFTAGASGFIEGAIKARKKQLIYARELPKPIIGTGYGKKPGGGRGRPRGSYAPQYRAIGGVYNARKIFNANLRLQKLQAMRESQVTPQQQAIINQFEMQQRARQMNIENRQIPDTRGEIPQMQNFHQEANAAAHLGNQGKVNSKAYTEEIEGYANAFS